MSPRYPKFKLGSVSAFLFSKPDRPTAGHGLYSVPTLGLSHCQAGLVQEAETEEKGESSLEGLWDDKCLKTCYLDFYEGRACLPPDSPDLQPHSGFLFAAQKLNGEQVPCTL